MTTLTHDQLRSDISHLLTIPPSSLSSLLIPSALSNPSQNHTAPQPTASSQSAIEFLETYIPSSTDPALSQRLIKAYIRDIRRDILPEGREGNMGIDGEKLGGRIDAVREKADGVGKALEGVKV